MFNAKVRVGLSGTVFVSKLAKHKIKNQNIKGYFGEQTFEISNLELMDQGYSSRVIVKIIRGNSSKVLPLDYKEQYDYGITENKDRNRIILRRVIYNGLVKDRLPILVIAKYRLHVKLIYKLLNKRIGNLVTIDWAHGDRKDASKVVKKFREGKIDVLVSSMIIRRGMNLPLMKAMINAGGGDAPEGPLQLLGRATRTHASKTHTYYEDFMDEGEFLGRHSRHRQSYYKNEGLKVMILY